MSKQINWGSDEDFIKNYMELKSSRKMGELYNCDKSSVLNHAKKINFNPNEEIHKKNNKLSEQDKQNIIASYNNKTSTELAKEYNVSRGMITKVWYDANLHGKKIITTKTTEKDITNQKFGKWTVLFKTDKRNAGGVIYWHCKCECGREKDVLGTSLREGKSLSCGLHSNISKGNTKIADILDKANINYEVEKTFSTCKDKKELPFDFYINNSYLIEYDGLQHFDENSIFNYEYTHNHDILKSKWCKENNIPLIRIPYTHYDNLCLADLILETTNFLDNADIKLRN